MSANVKVILNNKGGVGKSIISKYIFPTLLVDKYDSINVYEIDNNNSAGNFKSDFIEHRLFKIDEKNEAIFDVSFNEDEKDICSIVDCGGGDDVKAVIEALSKNKIENVDFYIPSLDDDETVDNIKDTIAFIREKYKKSKITLILNKANCEDGNIENAKEQFINIFGNEKYGYESRMNEISKDINSIAIIPNTKLIFLLKNHYRVPMTDMYLSGKEMIENLKENRKKWKEEAKEKNDKTHYFKKMELVEFATDLVDYVEVVKQTLKD